MARTNDGACGYRIGAGDIGFSVMAPLDRSAGSTMDVTIRWPEEDSREVVRLGAIIITAAMRATDPAKPAEAIDHPPDDIFVERCAAYTILLAKRR